MVVSGVVGPRWMAERVRGTPEEHSRMIGRFREVEDSYIETFARREDREECTVFRDEQLPDMYAFNCTVVKDHLAGQSLAEFVRARLAEAQLAGEAFLQLILDPRIELTGRLRELFLRMGLETQTCLYMRWGLRQLADFRGNEDCTVLKAVTEQELTDGQQLDIETSIGAGTPPDFARRKALRKRSIFQDANKQLFSYLCYHRGRPIGKCELYVRDEYAKIEDFDVLDRYQRQGFGTAMLKKMIADAAGLGARHIYLITDKDGTPREMYRKLGFEVIGEETQLFWSSGAGSRQATPSDL